MRGRTGSVPGLDSFTVMSLAARRQFAPLDFEAYIESSRDCLRVCVCVCVNHVNSTCSAMNLKPLSGLSHSYVSPRTGLKGLLPARW